MFACQAKYEIWILTVLGCNLVPEVFSFSNVTAAAILENEKTLGTSLARIFLPPLASASSLQ